MQKLSPDKALLWLRNNLPGPARVYAPGCSGEALLFAQAFSDNPELAAELTFLGIWIPGINRIDYAALHPTAKSELIFLSADFRDSFEAGKASFLPLTYTQCWPWLENTPLDAAFLVVSPPDQNGMCSLGVSADFTPAIMNRDDVLKIAHINPAMPAPASSPKIAYDSLDVVVEQEVPLLHYHTSELPPVYSTIADNIARLINDDDCLQFGLGNVQGAVLRALQGNRNLRIHSGMISDPVINAIDAGVFRADEGAITTGVALGTKALYDLCATDNRMNFKPVNFTHSIDTLKQISNFTAINSVIEVDLFGHANAEFINGHQVSGAGGLVDYLRGAAIAPNGKPIIALCSTARKGMLSRIVAKLESPSISINRADVGFVVTEHGIADLRGLSIDERATAMINIADPTHRTHLKNTWKAMREEL